MSKKNSKLDQIKLTISVVIVIILTISLSIPIGGLPGLGNLLNPYDGIYETARLSNKPEEAEIYSDQISEDVTVLLDDLEVPYIFAETDEDMFYTLGYIHAQDRLFQMDMQRRLAKGELAEIVGEEQIDSDIEMRKIGLGRAAEHTVEELEDTRFEDILEAYTEGVNQRIGEEKTPFEYKVLEEEVDEWTPTDTIAVSKLLSWGLSGTLEPIEHEELKRTIGLENWEELFPQKNPYSVPIHDSPYGSADNSNYPSESTDVQELTYDNADEIEGGSSLHSKARTGVGSNNWVVSSENSDTGAPILASDPHLGLQIPSLWYQAYLNSEEGYGTMGVTIPGVPVILMGANENISWGMTNISADDIEFYEYEITDGGERYYRGDDKLEFEEEEETINVKGSEDVQITRKSTIHGPVVDEIEDRPIAMKWTGHESWSELKAMEMINKAGDLEEFKDGLQHWHCPPQNFAYADKHGDIAMFSAGRFPIREHDDDYLPLVQNGSDPENDWIDHIPFEDIPRTVNPDEGHISSANQELVTEEYPYHIGRSFAPGYRGRRIDDLLSSKGSHSIEDFKDYQTDIFSGAAEEILPILLDFVENVELDDPERKAVNILEDWDHKMEKDEAAPLLWTIWEIKFFRSTFDEYYEMKGVQDLPLPDLIMTEKLLKNDIDIEFFEDQERIESKVIESLGETTELLEKEFEADITDIEWGEVNRYDLQHLTGLEALSYGPKPAAGGRTTLNLAVFTPIHPDLDEMIDKGDLEMEVTFGPSWRMIVSPGEYYSAALPGGQSGNPLSEHHADRLEGFLELEYDTFTLPKSAEQMSEDLVKNRLVVKTER